MLFEFIVITFLLIWLFLSIILLFFYVLIKYWNEQDFCKIFKKVDQFKNVSNIKSISEVVQKSQKRYDDLREESECIQNFISHEQKNELAILKAVIPEDFSDATICMQRLQSTIDDVLTFSDSRTQVECVDIITLCAMVCDEYELLYSNLYFQNHIEDEMYVLAKSRWIQRALSNLLDNAIKYGEGKRIEVIIRMQNQRVQVLVKDNGIGMNHQELDAITTRGYRITGMKENGYGIGLYLVDRVMQLCNGFFWIESAIGAGTTVYLIFPVTFQ